MRIIFFGTPSFVQPVFDVLEKQFEVIRYVDQSQEQLNTLKPDLFVVAAYGKILPPHLLKIPKYGSINIHPSLLPKYRGPSPVQTAILNGDSETGVSLIVMDEELDHGPIIAQTAEPILPSDTAETLLDRLFKVSANLLHQNIHKYIESEIKPSNQDHSQATFTKKLTREDGYIVMDNPPSPEIFNRMVRAYFPWPGVWTKVKSHPFGKLRAKVKIIKFLPRDRIQTEGGKPMSYKDFVNGYPEGRKLLSTFQLPFSND